MAKTKIKVCGSWLGFENYCILHDIDYKALECHCYEIDDKRLDELNEHAGAYRIEKCDCNSVKDSEVALPSEKNVRVFLKNVYSEDMKALKNADKLSPQDEPLNKYYAFSKNAGYYIKEEFFDYAEYQHTKIDYKKYLEVMGVTPQEERKVLDSMEKVYIVKASSIEDAMRQVKALSAKDSKAKDGPYISVDDIPPQEYVNIHKKKIQKILNCKCSDAQKLELLEALISFLNAAATSEGAWSDFENIRDNKKYSMFEEYVEAYKKIADLHNALYGKLRTADWASKLLKKYNDTINKFSAVVKKIAKDDSKDMAAYQSLPDGTETTIKHPGSAFKKGEMDKVTVKKDAE